MKSILYASLAGAALIALSLAWQGYLTPRKVTYVAQERAPEELKKTPEVSLLFVGDIMLDRGIRNIVNTSLGGDFSKMFENVKTEIFVPDISVFNLEGPVSDKGENVGSIYSFRMNQDVLRVLKEVGFDIASFSNNHVGDWGREAFEDTLRRAETSGMLISGAGFSYASTTEPLLVERNEIKVGFLSFSDVGPVQMKAGTSTSGILLLSDPNLETIVRRASLACDELVVMVHWGEEYKAEPTDRQKEFAHKLVDWGAKLVVGHHPHVIEPTEEYNGGLIAYSLGNFIFDQGFSKETMEGGVLEVRLDEKEIKKYQFKKVQMDSLFRPAFVENAPA